MNTRKGFTLVELLVVIAILAILATVSVVGYTSFINRANDSTAMQELTQVRDYIFAEDINNNTFSIVDGAIVVVDENGEVAQTAITTAVTVDAFLELLGAEDPALGLTGTITTIVEDGHIVTITYTKGTGSATWTVGGNIQ